MFFIGGLLTLALTLRSSVSEAELRRLHRWNLFVTTPALLLVWGAGVELALQAGWFGSLWLKLKLACVVALSLIHAWQTHRLARGGRGSTATGATQRWLPLLIALLVVAILYLVAAKPI
jgi:uncharacterized membrane protein